MTRSIVVQVPTQLDTMAISLGVAMAATASATPYCVFTNTSAGGDGKWWLECPGAGLTHTLTIGVNHVENCDPNATV
jgi:hypothetical protein